MLRILAITSLYPTSATPRVAAFNRQQLAALGALCNLEIWGTVPWLPLAHRLAPGSLAARARDVPASEILFGQNVEHPRTLHLPVIGRSISGPLYAASLFARVLRRRGEFDALLGTWAYPDGWATAAIGRALGVPVVIKVHGTDLNGLDARPATRWQLRRAFSSVDAVAAVSEPLARRARALGATTVRTIPNGVDAERFAVRSRAGARATLGIDADAELALFVGNLKRDKGVFDLLDAWPEVVARRPRARLLLVGDGPAAEAVARAAAALSSVTWAGAIDHADVPVYLAACNVLTLPSWNEGTPNVVLEALACGRPVVATAVGGIPDLLAPGGEPRELLGALVPPRDRASLAAALSDALGASPDPAEVRAVADVISWTESAARLHALLASCVAR